jgi:cycloartenol synthase
MYVDNSVPPEMWLLPKWFPLHPGKLWCHCRMVYLPMGYLYGSRFAVDATKDPLLMDLRKELYTQDYDTIDWDAHRYSVCEYDDYSPVFPCMKVAHWAMSWYERMPLKGLRQKALAFIYEYMHAEDLQTNFIDIGPVNKCMNMLCVFAKQGSDCIEFKKHASRLPDYLWIAEDGMKMQGYNGSQCWDTSFAIQASLEAGLCEDKAFHGMTKKVWAYMERTQILSTEVSKSSPANAFEDPENRSKFFRHVSRGGWPFSTSAHGWPISDCTAEGLKAVLKMKRLSCIAGDPTLVQYTNQRMFDSAEVLLSLQNPDGGWATYENNRGHGWYEWLNPSESFGDIMIDYSYVECSSATLQALHAFQQEFPTHRNQEITRSIARGKAFLKSIQRGDGSWYGSWACCFTYGTWFGVDGLLCAGEKPSSPAIQRAVDFTLKQQNANGGWGEDFSSCYDRAYSVDGAKMYGDEKSSGCRVRRQRGCGPRRGVSNAQAAAFG